MNFRYDVENWSMLLYMSKRGGIYEALQEINDQEISSTIEYLKYKLKVFILSKCPSFTMPHKKLNYILMLKKVSIYIQEAWTLYVLKNKTFLISFSNIFFNKGI